MEILPNGSILMHPVAQPVTPDGTVLEGHGVIPDIEVKLDHEMLLKGIDSQFDAAIRYLENKVQNKQLIKQSQSFVISNLPFIK